MIGVLSHNGRHSDWVLFELGAAWGMKKQVIPLLCGLSYSDLPGPLGEQNAVDASLRPKVFEMLDTIKDGLGIGLQSLARFEVDANKLVEAASQARMKDKTPEGAPVQPFIERHGVLWKKEPSGNYEEIAFCPRCKLAMSAFPPNSNQMLLCSHCDFTAPFRPSELKDLVSKLL